MSLRSEIVAAASRKVARSVDEIILEGIRRHIGVFDLSELRGRLRSEVYHNRPDEGETYFLDGRPFLTLFPPRFSTVDPHSVNLRQDYCFIDKR